MHERLECEVLQKVR